MTPQEFGAVLAGWHDFFLATASASAALLGLLFVGVSINLGTIPAAERADLRARAAQAFSNLVTIPQARQRIATLVPTLRRIGWTAVADVILAFTAWRIAQTNGEAAVISNLVAVVFVLLLGAADISWEMLTETGA